MDGNKFGPHGCLAVDQGGMSFCLCRTNTRRESAPRASQAGIPRPTLLSLVVLGHPMSKYYPISWGACTPRDPPNPEMELSSLVVFVIKNYNHN